MTMAVSKITRAGQITLPEKIRAGAFSNATAVAFEERGGDVVVRPLGAGDMHAAARDHLPLAEHTMRDWLDPVNDDLFEFPEAA